MMQRIVVADDEPNIRQLIAFMLRRRGYTVLEASDGDAALAIIRQEQPDLVVLDVMMPGLSGLQVARALAADAATATIPIVILSALAQEVEVQMGLQSGVQLYLIKPFAPRELAAHVADLLRGPAVPKQAQ